MHVNAKEHAMTATILRLSPNPAKISVPEIARPYREGAQHKSRYRTALRGLWRAWRRHRSRVSITSLNDGMLKDIGLTRADVEYEANKPFWRG